MRHLPVRGAPAKAALLLALIAGLLLASLPGALRLVRAGEHAELARGSAASAGGQAPTQNLIRGPVWMPTIHASPPPPPPEPDVDVTIRQTPSSEIQRGATLTYEFRVRNTGTAAASKTVIDLFYNRDVMAPSGSDLNASQGDWINFDDGFQLSISFGRVEAGQTRSGKVFFRIGSNVPFGTIIESRALYNCNVGQCRTNTVRVQVVRDFQPPVGTVRLLVQPDRATAGASRQITSDQYMPGERVISWINGPNGIIPLDLTTTADAAGRIRFDIRPSDLGLVPWDGYGFVAFGQSSGVTGLGPFIVDPGALAAAAPAGRSAPAALLPAYPLPGMATPELDGASGTGLPSLDAIAQRRVELQAVENGGISGRVTGAGGLPLPGVHVLVRDGAGVVRNGATTDANGRYGIFFGLPSGSYSVEFRTLFALDPTVTTYVSKRVDGVVVDAGAPAATRLDVTLEPGASISGRVTATGTGAGLEDVAVLVFDPAEAELLGITTTDVTGRYTVPGLAPGQYLVRFEPASATTGSVAGFQRSDYSVLVDVLARSNRSGVDIKLARGGGQITGRVTGADTGAGLEDVVAVISRADNTFAAIARTDEEGFYATPPLGAGSYSVTFLTSLSAAPATRAYLSDENDEVVVSASNVTGGVDAVLLRGATVSGLVQAADTSAGLADVPVFAYDAAGKLAGFGVTDDDGRYTTSGLPSGDYRVKFLPSFSSVPTSTLYVAEFYDNKRDFAGATTISLSAGRNTPNVNATLERGSRISGRITDAGSPSQGIRGVFVAVFDDANNIAAITLTDTQGNYTTPAVRSGSYRLWFTTIFSPIPDTKLYIDEWYNNRASRAEADLLPVSAPAPTPGVNAALVKGGQIAGQVRGSDTEAGVGGVPVYVYDGATLKGIATTDSFGRYDVSGLASGTYRVEFRPSLAADDAAGRYTDATVDDVDVVAPGVTTRDVTLSPT